MKLPDEQLEKTIDFCKKYKNKYCELPPEPRLKQSVIDIYQNSKNILLSNAEENAETWILMSLEDDIKNFYKKWDKYKGEIYGTLFSRRARLVDEINDGYTPIVSKIPDLTDLSLINKPQTKVEESVKLKYKYESDIEEQINDFWYSVIPLNRLDRHDININPSDQKVLYIDDFFKQLSQAGCGTMSFKSKHCLGLYNMNRPVNFGMTYEYTGGAPFFRPYEYASFEFDVKGDFEMLGIPNEMMKMMFHHPYVEMRIKLDGEDVTFDYGDVFNYNENHRLWKEHLGRPSNLVKVNKGETSSKN